MTSARYRNDYAAARTGHVHRATDLFAPAGSPVFAAHSGRVVWRPRTEQWGAGFAIWIRDRRGRTFAYYHLGRAGGSFRRAYARGLRSGDWVRRGELIGRVGDSGNAGGGSPHLHFEIHDPRISDPYGGYRRNPYLSLRRAQSDGPGPRRHGAAGASRGSARSRSLNLLRLGSSGQAVARWQRGLNEVAAAGLAVDGAFGPATHAATVRFQRAAGLGPRGLGVVGPRSRAALQRRLQSTGGQRARAAPARRWQASGAPLLRSGSSGPAVARWQRQLNRATRFRLVVDGAFGPRTRTATIRFQRSAGLGPAGLGIVGPKTRAAMARRL